MNQIAARLPVVMENVKGFQGWRIRDMVNWHRLLRPLRDMSQSTTDVAFYHILYEIFTLLAVRYEPCRNEPMAPPRWRRAPIDRQRGPRVALFVDSPTHVSGVATTIDGWLAEARKRDICVIMHSAGPDPQRDNAIGFPPLGVFKLVRAYDGLDMPVPDVDMVLNYMRSSSFDAVHVSTPGPMGLLGMIAAGELGLPLYGTYHTDFPSYAERLTGNPALRDITWHVMSWFYGKCDGVAAPSASTRRELLERGFNPATTCVVGRGVDTAQFAPSKRDESLRASWGLKKIHKLLYVGRLSREKNLACLAEAYRKLSRERNDICLVVVGEGPYQDPMMSSLAGLPVHFTGVQKGEALARIFASCDLFVFPSLTDTFGVVLIEAQASGLPVIVAAEGGCKDTLVPDVTGRVLPSMTPDALAEAVHRVLGDPAWMDRAREAARSHALSLTPAASFEAFWRVHDPAAAAARPAAALPQLV